MGAKHRTAVAALVLLLGLGLPSATPATAGSDGFAVGSSAWVNVAVVTLWTSPDAPRPVDADATSAPVHIRHWLSAMSTSDRRGLVGRVETQALYGDRLLVTGVQGGWLHVVAPGQPTHRDRRGYPGWVPARQLTNRAPMASSSEATVTNITTWLRTQSGSRVMEVSIGTRLPVLATSGSSVTVAGANHQRFVVAAAAVAVHGSGTAAQPRTRASVMATARAFLGRPYLWGGRSGFAVDCSGLTELVYAVHGVTIPRDTDDQAGAGRAASLSALRPADLVLFRSSSGDVHHVGLSVGNGRMLHAPHTGAFVEIAPVGQPALARRLLGG